MSMVTTCQKCGLPIFHGAAGYAGAQCHCHFSYQSQLPAKQSAPAGYRVVPVGLLVLAYQAVHTLAGFGIDGYTEKECLELSAILTAAPKAELAAIKAKAAVPVQEPIGETCRAHQAGVIFYTWLPYPKDGTKLYAAAPAQSQSDCLMVPRELLERVAKPVLFTSQEDSHYDACTELRVMLGGEA